MPRVKDIAWKFVIRLDGDKWRCPHCENEYLGKVTRVKSHLLKHPNKGISPCKKVPEHISMLMGCLQNQVCNKDDIAWKFVNRLEDNKWLCHYCSKEFFGDLTGVKGHLLKVPNDGISICTEVPDHVRELMRSLLDEVAEEESREANRQLSTLPSLVRNSHGSNILEQPASVSPQHQSVPHQSTNHRNMQPNPTMLLGNPDTTPQPDPSNHRLDAREPPALLDQPTHLETGSEQQNPRRLSSFPNDQFLGNSMSYWLQEFNGGDVLPNPLLSNITTTSIPQYSNEQFPSSDEQFEDGITLGSPIFSPDLSFLHRSQSQTLMDIDPPIALPHTSDSHNFEATITDSEVPGAAMDTIGPSSSQDMNRGSPIMNVPIIYANDEEIRNLKRKVEELYHKEAVIKEHMEIEPAASSVRKKLRILVEKWLQETERARNNFQMIGQANAEILPLTEQVETLIREGEELIQARDANGDAFVERKLIGEEIHRNIELIWNHLKENHVCKLGIYGMGGVGKTTIMMHVHNRLLKDATFDGVLFITVSQDFSIYKLQSDIWKALKFGVMEDEQEKKRAAMLSKCLERKKNCVLILDDVWRHFKLRDVGIPDKPGLKVVLTTRLSEVCSRMDCEEIKIQPLDEKEAWKLFVEELGPQTLKNIQFEKVARKITNRCAGLPLAINAMASSMRGEKNVFVWQDTLNKLERSHTKHTEMGDEVLPVLTLSYERLSDPQVKQCFVFCALFPEHESIWKMELIEYFIDEGFLDELDTREEQYCRGLAIVDKLRNACLLEVNNFDFVRMHDLMRDMALHITSTTYMVKAGQGLRTIPNGERWTEDLEKVSLMWGRIEDIPPDMSPNCPKLSTLLLNGSLQLENVQLQHSFFMKLQGLKVLNLSGCAITKLPDSVSELANLRALLLRNCDSLIRIPYLGKLKYLRKLDANGCESLLAVEGLEELSNLRYLDLSETGIERSWEGTFSRMVNLQYLRIAGKVKAEEVIRLKALKRLECNFGNVNDFNEYVRSMERSGHQNHNYELIVDQEKSLWFVTESVYSDPEILPENEIEFERDSDYGDYAKSVEIKSCNYAMARVGEERNNDSILIPGDVESFKGTNCRGMTNLSGMSRLRYLNELIIEKWDNLVELFGGAGVDAEEIDNTPDSPAPLFPSLETLEIRGCSKLKYLFGHESRFSLPLLYYVFIYECEGIEGLNSSVASPPQAGGGPAFPRLKFIIVEKCGNMKRVVGSEWLPHFPDLVYIEVRGCEGIEEIISGGGENQGGSAPLNTPSSFLPSPRVCFIDRPKLKTIPPIP